MIGVPSARQSKREFFSPEVKKTSHENIFVWFFGNRDIYILSQTFNLLYHELGEIINLWVAEAKIASMAVFGGTPKMPQGKELKKKSPQAREWAQGSLYLVISCKYKLKKGPFCGRVLFERRMMYAFLDNRFVLKLSRHCFFCTCWYIPAVLQVWETV